MGKYTQLNLFMLKGYQALKKSGINYFNEDGLTFEFYNSKDAIKGQDILEKTYGLAMLDDDYFKVKINDFAYVLWASKDFVSSTLEDFCLGYKENDGYESAKELSTLERCALMYNAMNIFNALGDNNTSPDCLTIQQEEVREACDDYWIESISEDWLEQDFDLFISGITLEGKYKNTCIVKFVAYSEDGTEMYFEYLVDLKV